MKKFFLFTVIHFFLLNVNAQVKIGAPGSPDVNAVLELAGTSKGLLLPRLSLISTSVPLPLSAFTAGMVVYNTTVGIDVRPGYYYSDGAKWIRISNSLETWSLGGNGGTNPASQFLGTSDSTNLAIRTNNIERIRITGSGTVEIGATSGFNSRLKVGGEVGGTQASLLLINGTNSPTGNGSIYSIRNTPSFGTSFSPIEVIGTSTDFQYTGGGGLVAGDYAKVSISGTNSHNSVIGVYGSVVRASTGTTDGSYIGGTFQTQIFTGNTGTVSSVGAIRGNVTIYNGGSSTILNAGGLENLIINQSDEDTVSVMYGLTNRISQNTATTVPIVYGVQNTLIAQAGGIFTDCYGTYTDFLANTGSIVRAYGHYVTPITATGIGEYRGILIGNIVAGSGVRRVFEYSGTGANDPVIINYDGSVQIGTTTPVTNAKLTIFDGHLQSGQTIKPTIIATANIGTGGTASLNDATDVAGIITIDLGTANWSAGIIATVTFNRAYVNPPVVILTPSSRNSAVAMLNQVPYLTTTATGFTISFAFPATDGSAMTFNYHVIETVNN